MSMVPIGAAMTTDPFGVSAGWRARYGAEEISRFRALGHPLGATGARLLTTLVHALEGTCGRRGLLTMCEGGGQANVTIIERP